MSAQPDHVPVTPYAPAPGAPVELLARLRADRRADTWVPAFEREWAAALEESRRTFSLAPLYEVLPGPGGPSRLRSGRRRVRRLRLRRQRLHRHGGAPQAAPVTEQQPYAIRFSAPAAKVFDTLPEHIEDMVWDVLDAVAAGP